MTDLPADIDDEPGAAAGSTLGQRWSRRSSGARRLLRGRLPGQADIDGQDEAAIDEAVAVASEDRPSAAAPEESAPRGPAGFFGRYVFTSLTRRILLTNFAALIALVSGFLYLDRFRDELIEARVESLLTQGKIISAALGASARISTDALTIDPESLLQLEGEEARPPADLLSEEPEVLIDITQIKPVMRRLIRLTYTQARVYDTDGELILDSNRLYSQGETLQYQVPPLAEPEPPIWVRAWRRIVLWFNDRNLPLYPDEPGGGAEQYREVMRALTGSPFTEERVTGDGQIILSVAVPIKRFNTVVGVLQLSTKPGRIDRKLDGERDAIMKVFAFAALVTLLLSIFLSSTIAQPLYRLSAAAERVRRRVKNREEIPDFSYRRDEIGDLSKTLRDMTGSLYSRIEAIERFAADVSHELKNPLTSLRSAIETLPLAKRADQRERLLEVIDHDVQRLDRLISDISDASRLDAEMAREDYEPVDLAHMTRMTHASAEQVMQNKLRAGEAVPRLVLNIHGEVARGRDNVIDRRRIMVRGNDTRLGQVIANIVSNARSFVPADGGWIAIDLRTRPADEARGETGPASSAKGWAVLTIADNGPGIPPDKKSKIFERFYTDRPEGEAFGNNSGLGLSIVRQIVEAHGGTIEADNWTLDDRFESDLPDLEGGPGAQAAAARRGGAIFTVTLPLMDERRG